MLEKYRVSREVLRVAVTSFKNSSGLRNSYVRKLHIIDNCTLKYQPGLHELTSEYINLRCLVRSRKWGLVSGVLNKTSLIFSFWSVCRLTLFILAQHPLWWCQMSRLYSDASLFCKFLLCEACSFGLSPTRLMSEDRVYTTRVSCTVYWNSCGVWP
jgi:hypothetical protein